MEDKKGEEAKNVDEPMQKRTKYENVETSTSSSVQSDQKKSGKTEIGPMDATEISGILFRWMQVPANRNIHFFGFLSQRYEPECCSDLFTDVQIESNKQKLGQFLDENNMDEAMNVRTKLLKMVPNNADILEYLYKIDINRGDFMAAEGIVSRLLYLFPDEKKYKSYQQKLLPKVDAADKALFDEIDKLKLEFMAKQTLIDPKLIAARKACFLERFWQNTLAIEGVSLTLDQIIEKVKKDEAKQRASSEEEDPELLELDGVMELNKYLEQQNYKEPIDLLKLDREELLLMHRKQMIKIMNYEEFAAHLCGKFREEDCEEVFHQQPYQPVYSDQIENEIEKFCKFIKDGIEMVEKGEMHPVELAALAKYYFVHIHPFVDGNGRMSRTILNIVLQCFSYPPIIIQNRKKEEYIDAIEAAVVGDVRQFVRLIANYVAESLRVSVQQGGIPYPELDGE